MPNQEEPIHQRVAQLIDTLEGGNKSAFARQLGVLSGTIGDILGQKKTKPGFDLLTKILEAYSDVRSEWLMLGRGSMLKSEAAAPSVTDDAAAPYNTSPAIRPTESPKPQAYDEPRVVALDHSANKSAIIFNVKAAANYLTGYDSQEPVEELDVLSLPKFMLRGHHHAVFPVVGDSMEPTFLAKDYVVCRFIPPQDWANIRDYDVCVIVSRAYGLQLKRLKIRPDEQLIRCRSDNRRHRPFNLDFSEVVEIWRFEWRLTASAENITEDLFKKVDALEDQVQDLRVVTEGVGDLRLLVETMMKRLQPTDSSQSSTDEK